MPVTNYGVLKCKAVETRSSSNERPHYQIRATAKGEDYRIAINVKSEINPSELLYNLVENFQHPMTDGLVDLPEGFTPLKGKRTLALDYIRSNLFQQEDMTALPHQTRGDYNDLNERFDYLVQKAIKQDADLYVFGDPFGPEAEQKDSVFGFVPSQGIKDVHMNQGNVQGKTGDDGVYQDGGLLFYFPAENRWSGIFLSFQSQSWHTDDETGRVLEGVVVRDRAPEVPEDEAEESPVLIVGAAVTGPQERVTLLNVTHQTINLLGWSLANQAKEKYSLTGRIAPGEFLTVALENRTEFFKNTGDIITLLDQNGLKVDGEAYTRQQVKAGRTIAF